MSLRKLDWVLVLLIAALASVPFVADWVGQQYYIEFFRRVMIIGLAAVSLDLILGYGGLISFGHAAFVGVGAYAVGILSFYGVQSGVAHLAMAVAAAAFVSFVIGWVSVRTSGVYFIMITLALAQMLYFLMVSLRQYGGDDGMSLNSRSKLPALDLHDEKQFFYLVLFILVIALIFCGRIVNSRFGMVLRGCMENERRMRALGFSTNRYKIFAFVIAGCIASVSGALLANQGEYVSPDYMHWSRSGDLLVIVVIGGVGSLIGPVFGAVAFLGLEQMLATVTKHWQIVFGPLLVLIVLLTRGGFMSLLKRDVEHPAPPVREPVGILTAAPANGRLDDNASTILSIRHLVRRFGGLAATDDFSLDVRQGETMALIGPNGAGKTTLVSQLSGEQRPDAGHIFFQGRDVTALDMPERAQLGIARSFQITSVCLGFTALENVMLAVQSRQGGNFNLVRKASTDKGLIEPSLEALSRVDLLTRANIKAGMLSHGERRQLEIAMALALDPKLLLLDEPMAGMGREESAKMVSLIKSLKGRHTIVLIEHDMDAVFSLADRITVLVRGKCLITGTTETVRANAEVKASYLGEDAPLAELV